MKRILSIAALMLITGIFARAQEVTIPVPMTNKQFRSIADTIVKYAPSKAALQIVNNVAAVLSMTGRPADSRLVYSLFKTYFPGREDFFDRQKEHYTQAMLSLDPDPTSIRAYDVYINEEAPSEDAFVAVQRIAGPYIERRSWDSAADVYRRYLPLFPHFQGRIQRIIEILEAPEEGIQVRNIGPTINSRRAEWDPTPTPDGRYLFFSANNRRGGKGRDDIWLSVMKDDNWQKPKPLGNDINSRGDETIDNVTPDGTGLMMSGTFDSTFGGFDIFQARKSSEGWSSIEHFPRPVNSEYVDEGACLTADGMALVFTSDRPGGQGQFHRFSELFHGSIHGNMDIYVCLRTDTGWSEPINLGPVVNTPFAERSPYLHPDGKTLYFSSDGHPGLGRLDVFKTTRLSDDSWTDWSEPVNFGKEINSSSDDWGYNITVHGDTAFFSALDRPDSYGNWDIYTIKIPKNVRPGPVILIKGTVTDAEGNPLSAGIKWEDLKTGEIAGMLRSDPADGAYTIALPPGRHYGYYAELDGYYPTSKSIDLRQLVAEPDVKENIVLVSIKEMKEKGAKVRINNLFFDFDKAELKKESFPELRRLAAFLKKNKGLKVQIDGHTDKVGSESYNFELSERRAEAVRNYLISLGCNPMRFSIKGYGTRKPMGDNQTDFGRSMNRRVEIWFVGTGK